jgi:hypothetical protein
MVWVVSERSQRSAARGDRSPRCPAANPPGGNRQADTEDADDGKYPRHDNQPTSKISHFTVFRKGGDGTDVPVRL